MPVGFAGVALKTITVTVFQKVTVNEGRRQGVFFCNIEPGFMSLGVCWLRKGKKRKFPAHHLRPRQFWPFSWAGHLEALPKSPLPSRPLAITSTPSTFHQSFTNFMKYFLSSRHFGC